MERTVTPSEVTGIALQALRNDLFHCWPAAVVSYDDTQETATVQQMLNDVRFNLDTGARVSEPGTQIAGVPVVFPRGGGMVIKWQLNKNDPGILWAFDLDPTPWREQGRSLNPVDPRDVRRHGGAYWAFIPVDVYLKKTPSSPGKLTIGAEGQSPLVTIDGSHITLGSAPTDFAAIANLVSGELTKIKNALAALTVTSPSGGGACAITYVPPTAQYSTVGNVASSLIKVQ